MVRVQQRNPSSLDAYPIDFVIPWVDSRDPHWQSEKSKWLAKESSQSYLKWATGTTRYQDWDLLKFWFRGIEKFTPWVHKVFFITCGHLPNWLDTHSEKLVVVPHDEYIPKKYLPTFNSRVIELNMHRIADLAEHFVYFNDDTFVVKPLKREFFFSRGLPRDFAGLEAAHLDASSTQARPFNAMVINKHFSQRDVVFKHLGQWMNPKYGLRNNLKTLAVLPWPYFSSIQRNHLPSSFLKSTFEEVWNEEHDKLDEDCMHKFRSFEGVNQWLMRDWQRAKGSFLPIRQYKNAEINCSSQVISEELAKSMKAITQPRVPMISINDFADTQESYELWSNAIREAFEQLLPTPSIFEIATGGGSSLIFVLGLMRPAHTVLLKSAA